MTNEKKNFLTENAIETFILANVLHAIDHDLLKCDFKDVEIRVVVTPVEQDKDRYAISLSLKDKKLITFYVAGETESRADQYRQLMGGTMAVLDALLGEAEKNKPVLKIVK